MLPGICAANVEFRAWKCVVATARQTTKHAARRWMAVVSTKSLGSIHLSSELGSPILPNNRFIYSALPGSLIALSLLSLRPALLAFIHPYLNCFISPHSPSRHSFNDTLHSLRVISTRTIPGLTIWPFLQQSPVQLDFFKLCCSCSRTSLKPQLDYSWKEIHWTPEDASDPTSIAKAIYSMQSRR